MFETLLDEVKPDFLIMKTTDMHHNQIFYQMCRSKGIKVMMLEQSRFGHKCLVTQERDKIDYVSSLIDLESTNKTIEEAARFLKNKQSICSTNYIHYKIHNFKVGKNKGCS